jgi:hypothetical protein
LVINSPKVTVTDAAGPFAPEPTQVPGERGYAIHPGCSERRVRQRLPGRQIELKREARKVLSFGAEVVTQGGGIAGGRASLVFWD